MPVHVHFTYVLVKIQQTDTFISKQPRRKKSFLLFYESTKLFSVMEKFPLQKFCLLADVM